MKRGCYTKIPGSDVAVIFDGRAEGIIDGSSESEGRAEGINDGDGSVGDVEGLSVFDGRAEEFIGDLSDGDVKEIKVGLTVGATVGLDEDGFEVVGLADVGRTVRDVGFRVVGLPDVGLDVEGLFDGLDEVGLFVGLLDVGLDVGLYVEGLFDGLDEVGLFVVEGFAVVGRRVVGIYVVGFLVVGRRVVGLEEIVVIIMDIGLP
jgi:hypothetical protein